MLWTRPSVLQDAHSLAPRLRAADVAEIRASSGQSPLDALTGGFAASSPRVTIVTSDQTVAGMFGLCRTRWNVVGAVWMLGSNDIAKNSISFLRQSREWIERFHSIYPVLWNYVDERNTTHISWLRWLGCQFVRTLQHGVENRNFMEFIHV